MPIAVVAPHTSTNKEPTCSQPTIPMDSLPPKTGISSTINSSSTAISHSAPAAPPSSVVYTKSGSQVLQGFYHAAQSKASYPFDTLAIHAFMAGLYIAAAGQLYLTASAVTLNKVVGSALFSTGLVAVVLTGAELFTGDCLVFAVGVLGRQVSWYSLLRHWCWSWIMNAAGSLLWAFLLGYLSDALTDAHAADVARAVAEHKANQALGHIFLKGIGCNFLVCLGLWQAMAAHDVAGKILALWFPVTAFVAMGFDHCIANQFLIPVGMMLGAQVTVGRLFLALLMATAGNVVGGSLLVGAIYYYAFDPELQEQRHAKSQESAKPPSQPDGLRPERNHRGAMAVRLRHRPRQPSSGAVRDVLQESTLATSGSSTPVITMNGDPSMHLDRDTDDDQVAEAV